MLLNVATVFVLVPLEVHNCIYKGIYRCCRHCASEQRLDRVLRIYEFLARYVMDEPDDAEVGMNR